MKKIIKFPSLLILFSLLCSCSNGAINYKDVDYIKTLNWHEDFLVCHLGDLHLNVASDIQKQLDYYQKVIYSYNNQKPDVVILNGDTFMNSNKECVTRLFDFLDGLEIPYAFNYGNHDLQGSYSPDFIDNCLKNAQYALYADTPNDNVYGRSNLLINIKNNDELKYQIFLLDSNSYLGLEYDCIHQDQIEWYERMLLSTHGYSSAPNNIANDTFKKNLLFTHIPTLEFKKAYNEYKNNFDDNIPVLSGDDYCDMREGISASKKETRLFEYINKYKATTMIGVNHDHVNNTDLWYKEENSDWAVRLIYGQKAGISCYFDETNIGATFYQLFDTPKKSINGNDLYFNDIKMYVPYSGEAEILWQNELA